MNTNMQVPDEQTRPLILVSNNQELEAAKQIVGDLYAVESMDGGLPPLDKIPNREVILWLNREEFVNAAEKDSFVAMLNTEAKSVRSISSTEEGKGFSPLECLDGGFDQSSFIEFAKATMVEHAKVAYVEEPSIEEDGAFIEPVPSQREAWAELALVLTEKKIPVTNLDNVVRCLEGTSRFAGRIWFDEFAFDTMTNFGSKEGRLWTDSDTLALQMQLQRYLGINRISFEMVHAGVVAYANLHKRNPAKEWLSALQWDGVSRLGGFFVNYMNAVDTPYTTAISENFFLSMVARVFQPGCKVDNMIVLEGGQGRMKSTALKAIAGKWFTECNEPISNGQNKDFYSILRGKMLVEIAELDSFSKADVKRIKAIITTATDRYRPPYGKVAQEFPRTCVFAGTTNEQTYLDDPTGARRFWPIRIGAIELDKIRSDREQIFAEAVARYKASASWWVVPADLALVEQEARRKADSWEEVIGDYILAKDYVTTQEIAVGCLKIDVERIDRRVENRIGACLTVLGWETKSVWCSLTKKSKRKWNKKVC